MSNCFFFLVSSYSKTCLFSANFRQFTFTIHIYLRSILSTTRFQPRGPTIGLRCCCWMAACYVSCNFRQLHSHLIIRAFRSTMDGGSLGRYICCCGVTSVLSGKRVESTVLASEKNTGLEWSESDSLLNWSPLGTMHSSYASSFRPNRSKNRSNCAIFSDLLAFDDRLWDCWGLSDIVCWCPLLLPRCQWRSPISLLDRRMGLRSSSLRQFRSHGDG